MESTQFQMTISIQGLNMEKLDDCNCGRGEKAIYLCNSLCNLYLQQSMFCILCNDKLSKHQKCGDRVRIDGHIKNFDEKKWS